MNWKLLADLALWESSEDLLLKWFERNWYTIRRSENPNAILDFTLEHNWKNVHLELKTRRCNKADYEDTVIWANKLAEAWSKFYSYWEETLFLFQYLDGLYYISPLDVVPRRQHTLMRWDRWWIDKPKGWIFYKTENLIKIN